jgi:hypothetical protein
MVSALGIISKNSCTQDSARGKAKDVGLPGIGFNPRFDHKRRSTWATEFLHVRYRKDDQLSILIIVFYSFLACQWSCLLQIVV